MKEKNVGKKQSACQNSCRPSVCGCWAWTRGVGLLRLPLCCLQGHQGLGHWCGVWSPTLFLIASILDSLPGPPWLTLLWLLCPWREPCSAIFFFPLLSLLAFMAAILRCLPGHPCHTLWIALPTWLQKLWAGRSRPCSHSGPTLEPALMASFLEARSGPVLSLRWASSAASLGAPCL